jgi:hypothetical protein
MSAQRITSNLTASGQAADTVAVNAGLMLRIRAWFSALMSMPSADLWPDDAAESPSFPFGTRPAHQLPSVGKGATVIAFPRSVKVQLTQLASDLHQRFAALGLHDYAPVQLRVDGGDEPCLWVDNSSYVEACSVGFRVVFNDAFGVRITMESAELESIGEFVRHYIIARFEAARAMRGSA